MNSLLVGATDCGGYDNIFSCPTESVVQPGVDCMNNALATKTKAHLDIRLLDSDLVEADDIYIAVDGRVELFYFYPSASPTAAQGRDCTGPFTVELSNLCPDGKLGSAACASPSGCDY